MRLIKITRYRRKEIRVRGPRKNLSLRTVNRRSATLVRGTRPTHPFLGRAVRRRFADKSYGRRDRQTRARTYARAPSRKYIPI